MLPRGGWMVLASKPRPDLPPAPRKPPLELLLAAPRGFCAGVERAIQMVEAALEKFGPPIYVRHAIVHNRFVVENLEARGAIFVDALDQVPAGASVVFSAHGVPKSVPDEAIERNLISLDATCPLVSKVHREAEHHHARGLQIVLIGHAGHPEVIGTMGQLPPGAILLVESLADVERLQVADPQHLAFITQTTLSVDETADIIAALQARFHGIRGPGKADICYATTNRQSAIKTIAPRCDALLVIGAPHSSNSRHLVEVARKAGCADAFLVQDADEIDWAWFGAARTVGVTAGASAPEALVEAVVAAFERRYDVRLQEVAAAVENVRFRLPRALEV